MGVDESLPNPQLNEMELILDSIPALIFYKDLKNNFIRVNKYLADAHHCNKSELIGKNLSSLYPKAQSQAYWEDDLSVAKTKKPLLNIEEKWTTDSGIRWVSTSKIPILDTSQNVTGIIGISIDITEIKHVEQVLRENEQKFRYVLENSPEVIYRFDFLNKKYDYISSGATDVLGYTPEEMMTLGLQRATKYVHPQDKMRLIQNFQESSFDGVHLETKKVIEFRFFHKIKGYRWLKDNQLVIFSPQKTPLYLIGNISDIHEQKLYIDLQFNSQKILEQLVSQRTQELMNLMEYKTNFYSAISHELRTPLNAIIGFLQLLTDGNIGTLSDAQLEILNDITKSAFHLHNLIQDVLQISALEQGKNEINKEFVDFNKLILILRLLFEEITPNPSNKLQIIQNIEKNVKVKVDLEIFSRIIRNILIFIFQKVIKPEIIFNFKERDNFLAIELRAKIKLSEIERKTIFTDFDIYKSIQLENTEQSGLNFPLLHRLIKFFGSEMSIDYSQDTNQFWLEIIFK